MNDAPSKRWALSRGERIAIAATLGLLALVIVGMLGAVATATMPRSGLSAVDMFVLGSLLVALCFAALAFVLLRIWWVRQPNHHAWFRTSWREWQSKRAVGIVLSLIGFSLGCLAAVALPTHLHLYEDLLWLFGIGASCAWLGAGLIYNDARQAASPATQGLMRFFSYAITAAGVMSVLYAGACALGTFAVASIVGAPQGSPLGVFLLGLTVIIPASIIAASLVFSGSQLRKRGGEAS